MNPASSSLPLSDWTISLGQRASIANRDQSRWGLLTTSFLHGSGSALEFNHTARFAEQIKSIASQDQPMRASACVRSATMSSTCSMPMEARMVASEIPRRSRVSGGTPEWRWWRDGKQDSVPPRMTASLKALDAASSTSPPRIKRESAYRHQVLTSGRLARRRGPARQARRDSGRRRRSGVRRGSG